MELQVMTGTYATSTHVGKDTAPMQAYPDSGEGQITCAAGGTHDFFYSRDTGSSPDTIALTSRSRPLQVSAERPPPDALALIAQSLGCMFNEDLEQADGVLRGSVTRRREMSESERQGRWVSKCFEVVRGDEGGDTDSDLAKDLAIDHEKGEAKQRDEAGGGGDEKVTRQLGWMKSAIGTLDKASRGLEDFLGYPRWS